MFDTFAALRDWFGIIVFATSGALVASRKQMDVVGFVLLGTATESAVAQSAASSSTLYRCSGCGSQPI